MSFCSHIQAAAAALQAAMQETLRDRHNALLNRPSSNTSNGPVIRASERLAVLRHLEHGVRQLDPSPPGDREAPRCSTSQPSQLQQDFRLHQLWWDGAVLYRVESSPRSRHCCQLVPLSGRAQEPLRRTWHNTSGLQRVS